MHPHLLAGQRHDFAGHELVAIGPHVFTGSLIVLIPILLVAHAGTRYGIPYPVFARLWFGLRGAHLPALRAR